MLASNEPRFLTDGGSCSFDTGGCGCGGSCGCGSGESCGCAGDGSGCGSEKAHGGVQGRTWDAFAFLNAYRGEALEAAIGQPGPDAASYVRSPKSPDNGDGIGGGIPWLPTTDALVGWPQAKPVRQPSIFGEQEQPVNEIGVIPSPDWWVSRDVAGGPEFCLATHDWDDIPVCPCTRAEALAMAEDGCVRVSEDAKVFVNFFHSPAKSCLRLSFAGGTQGNQCCFDGDGKIITEGSGAGTPDLYNQDQVGQHLVHDVLPWFDESLEDYHKKWPPTHKKDCPRNTGQPGQPLTGSTPLTPGEVERILAKLQEHARQICHAKVMNVIMQSYPEGPTAANEDSMRAEYEQMFEECYEEVYNALISD